MICHVCLCSQNNYFVFCVPSPISQLHSFLMKRQSNSSYDMRSPSKFRQTIVASTLIIFHVLQTFRGHFAKNDANAKTGQNNLNSTHFSCSAQFSFSSRQKKNPRNKIPLMFCTALLCETVQNMKYEKSVSQTTRNVAKNPLYTCRILCFTSILWLFCNKCVAGLPSDYEKNPCTCLKSNP